MRPKTNTFFAGIDQHASLLNALADSCCSAEHATHESDHSCSLVSSSVPSSRLAGGSVYSSTLHSAAGGASPAAAAVCRDLPHAEPLPCGISLQLICDGDETLVPFIDGPWANAPTRIAAQPSHHQQHAPAAVDAAPASATPAETPQPSQLEAVLLDMLLQCQRQHRPSPSSETTQRKDCRTMFRSVSNRLHGCDAANARGCGAAGGRMPHAHANQVHDQDKEDDELALWLPLVDSPHMFRGAPFMHSGASVAPSPLPAMPAAPLGPGPRSDTPSVETPPQDEGAAPYTRTSSWGEGSTLSWRSGDSLGVWLARPQAPKPHARAHGGAAGAAAGGQYASAGAGARRHTSRRCLLGYRQDDLPNAEAATRVLAEAFGCALHGAPPCAAYAALAPAMHHGPPPQRRRRVRSATGLVGASAAAPQQQQQQQATAQLGAPHGQRVADVLLAAIAGAPLPGCGDVAASAAGDAAAPLHCGGALTTGASSSRFTLSLQSGGGRVGGDSPCSSGFSVTPSARRAFQSWLALDGWEEVLDDAVDVLAAAAKEQGASHEEMAAAEDVYPANEPAAAAASARGPRGGCVARIRTVMCAMHRRTLDSVLTCLGARSPS